MFSRYRLFLFSALSLVVYSTSAQTQENQPSTELPPVVVHGQEVKQGSPFSPPEKDSKIFEEKKVTVQELESVPPIVTNNYRQMFSEIPGLLVSEVGNESFSSINFRGLGDPHESFNLNILKDGIPISADPYGYPAVYYQPPVELIDRIEFVRGGGALLYGPQAGGALNYVTIFPSPDEPTSFQTKQILGSENLWSTFNQITTSQDGVGVLGYYHRRQSDGFRDANSDYYVNNGGLKFAFESSPDTVWHVELDAYDASHHEPGGLTLESGPGLANYYEDREQNTLDSDQLNIERYVPTIIVHSDLSADTTLSGRLWGGYYRRESRRQDLGAAPAFGGFPLGETNTIQLQEFRFVGAETRVSHDWQWLDNTQTLSTGIFLFGDDSPFQQEKGSAPDASTGDLVKDISRNIFDVSLFVENRFAFGNFSVTPGFRLENIYQEIDEKMNTGSVAPLRSTDQTDTVPLFGLGLAYQLGEKSEMYGNISQGYKPVTFQDTVPLGTGDTISEDIEEADTLAYELGVRGEPVSWAHFDTSVFAYNFDNIFGRVDTAITNTGEAQYYGVDLAGDINLFSLTDAVIGEDKFSSFGEFRFYTNVSFLDAEFTEGSLDGKTPQYAPDYLLRFGGVYSYPEFAKVALLGTYVDEHFADDGNTTNRFIPSYVVWDLTAEFAVYKDTLSVIAGINNLFDQEYYSRIRSNGIEPAPERNFYAGVNVRF